VERGTRGLFPAAAALVVTAILLGGGGASSPVAILVIGLLGLVLLAVALWRPREMPFDRVERAGIFLASLVAATPLVQLVPLPPGLWRALPGRDIAFQIADAAQIEAWQPLSIDREASWLAAAYLISPVAIFLTTLKLDGPQRRRLAWLVVGGALFSLALAALQFTSGPGMFRLYGGGHSALATGLFINRNHQVDLLLIGMILFSALFWNRPGGNPWLWLAMVIAFAAGVLATMSRTGLLVIPLAILASASFIPSRHLRERKLLSWGVIAALCGGVVLAAGSASVRKVIKRLEPISDIRFDYWSDVWFVAGEYFPFGSGIGTFSLAFRLYEDLNHLQAPYFNHAHNDYLQILVETGLWGGLLTLIFIGGYLCLGWARRGHPLKRAAAFSILILLLHSLVDYPLRMPSLITLFGFLCGVLVVHPCPPGGVKGLSKPTKTF